MNTKDNNTPSVQEQLAELEELKANLNAALGPHVLEKPQKTRDPAVIEDSNLKFAASTLMAFGIGSALLVCLIAISIFGSDSNSSNGLPALAFFSIMCGFMSGVIRILRDRIRRLEAEMTALRTLVSSRTNGASGASEFTQSPTPA